jgi:hypothetical protein
MHGLLVEAAQSAVRYESEMRRVYQRLAQRKCRALAKVAMARKLAVRLYWMLHLQVDYAQLPGTFCGRGLDRLLDWTSCLHKALGSLNRIMVLRRIGIE